MAAQGVPEPSAAKQPSDYRNGDLVTRLLAATPPYLYNMPLLPNSFFFSEMLRSFVQAKASSSVSSLGQQPSTGRRGRKRTWKEATKMHHSILNIHPDIVREHDKPLELTTSSRTPPPSAPPPPPPPPPPPTISQPSPPPQPSQTPNNLLLPHAPQNAPDFATPTTASAPPPPLWYPPSMYHQPPYATTAPFDPLHFFIDLHVSGHIWDQTKNHSSQQSNGSNRPMEPLDLQTDHDKKFGINLKTPSTSSTPKLPAHGDHTSLFKQSRKHMSAFAVPRPRDVVTSFGVNTSRGFPCNTDITKCVPSQDSMERNKKLDSWYQNKNSNVVSTNYVLQNLSKIYKQVEIKSKNKGENDVKFKEDEEEILEVKDDDIIHKSCNNLEKLDVDVKNNENDDDDDDKVKQAEEDKKCRDLRALIGLELVKDFVSYDGERYPRGCAPIPDRKDGVTSTGDVDELSAECPTFKKEKIDIKNADDVVNDVDPVDDDDDDDDESSNIQVDDDDDEDEDEDDDDDDDDDSDVCGNDVRMARSSEHGMRSNVLFDYSQNGSSE